MIVKSGLAVFAVGVWSALVVGSLDCFSQSYDNCGRACHRCKGNLHVGSPIIIYAFCAPRGGCGTIGIKNLGTLSFVFPSVVHSTCLSRDRCQDQWWIYARNKDIKIQNCKKCPPGYHWCYRELVVQGSMEDDLPAWLSFLAVFRGGICQPQNAKCKYSTHAEKRDECLPDYKAGTCQEAQTCEECLATHPGYKRSCYFCRLTGPMLLGYPPGVCTHRYKGCHRLVPPPLLAYAFIPSGQKVNAVEFKAVQSCRAEPENTMGESSLDYPTCECCTNKANRWCHYEHPQRGSGGYCMHQDQSDSTCVDMGDVKASVLLPEQCSTKSSTRKDGNVSPINPDLACQPCHMHQNCKNCLSFERDDCVYQAIRVRHGENNFTRTGLGFCRPKRTTYPSIDLDELKYPFAKNVGDTVSLEDIFWKQHCPQMSIALREPPLRYTKCSDCTAAGNYAWCRLKNVETGRGGFCFDQEGPRSCQDVALANASVVSDSLQCRGTSSYKFGFCNEDKSCGYCDKIKERGRHGIEKCGACGIYIKREGKFEASGLGTCIWKFACDLSGVQLPAKLEDLRSKNNKLEIRSLPSAKCDKFPYLIDHRILAIQTCQQCMEKDHAWCSYGYCVGQQQGCMLWGKPGVLVTPDDGVCPQ